MTGSRGTVAVIGLEYSRGAIAAALVAGLFLLAILAPPFVDSGPRAVIYLLLAPLCHQLPERAWQIDGIALGVCARCTGIYAGLLLGALTMGLLTEDTARRIHRQARTLLLASLALLGFDWMLGMTGIYASGPAVRTLTGLIFGAVAGLLVGRAIRQLEGRHIAVDGESGSEARPGVF